MANKPNLLQKSNTAASGVIRDKAAVRSELMSGLLPDIRARAICVARLDDERGAIGRIREALAKVPEGGDWHKARKAIRDDVFGEWFDPETQDNDEALGKLREAAEGKAEFLLKTHVFQAYSASRYREQQEFADDFPYLMYITMGDGSVRESHEALDGTILPADDPFWETHYPPWDWGCRCIVESLTREDAEERGITTAREIERFEHKFPDGENTFEFHPGSLAIPIKDLRGDMTDEKWGGFMQDMMNRSVVMPGGERVSVWEWLEFDGNPIVENGTIKFRPAATMREAESFATIFIGRRLDHNGGTPSLKAINNANETFRRAMVRGGVKRVGEYGTYSNPNAVAAASRDGFWFNKTDFENPEAAFRRDVSNPKAENGGIPFTVAPSAKRYLEASAEHEVAHNLILNSANRRELRNKLREELEMAKNNKSINKVSRYAAQDEDEFFSELYAMYRTNMPMTNHFKKLVEDILNEIRI